MNRLLFCFLALAAAAPLFAEEPCVAIQPGVRMPCPKGWHRLTRDFDAVVISNVPPTAENKDRRSGPGMATISIYAKPANYEDLARWIWVGKKNVPDAKETKIVVTNASTGKIEVTCLDSPQPVGPAYFFQIGKTPVLIELVYRANDPKKDEYRAAAIQMIEQAVPASGRR